jgi:hypothetical protein
MKRRRVPALSRVVGSEDFVSTLDRVLDKGIVIDDWVRMSLVGIDIVTSERPVVVASVDGVPLESRRTQKRAVTDRLIAVLGGAASAAEKAAYLHGFADGLLDGARRRR